MDELFRKKTKNPWTMLQNSIDDKIFKTVGPVGKGKLNRSGTAEEWSAYRQRSKLQCPFLFRVDEYMDDVGFFFGRWIRFFWEDPRSYFRNVFINPMWMVRSKELKIGQWIDTDTRILYMNMEMLRFFIEEDNTNYKNEEGDFEPWEVKEFKKKEKGEPSEFDGEHGLVEDEGGQYHSMKIAWDIYLWWKDYKNREAEIEAIYTEIPKSTEHDKGDIMAHFSKDRREISKPYHDRIHALEKKLDDERHENLINLMKIHRSLWS